MSRSPKTTTLVLLLCLAVVAMGCVGPFNMTGQVLHWNRNVSDHQWIQEGVFLLLVIVPVYGLTILADGIVFNSIEFWTGDNPIKAPGTLVTVAVSETEGEVEVED